MQLKCLFMNEQKKEYFRKHSDIIQQSPDPIDELTLYTQIEYRIFYKHSLCAYVFNMLQGNQFQRNLLKTYIESSQKK